ncbi:putative hydrolase MutT/NUDIX [Actinomadura rubrobrunea]|uniref:Hydrolase MutT/NUDIX n=1 Tax=Actinomadura rubrobrunea TaxID=115335 RepID=A0A9W6PZP8_9ACTN|nr:NUDIX domain-containing protein [Actinomadura rubrobrunea]GLW66101.1 putative hydrolase MutT/NUDIX [Actinomadura rubrobrunea]
MGEPADGARPPIRAAGAVLWRPGGRRGPGGGDHAPEVALIHRPRYDDWSFPKGKLKRGEHPLRGAIREIEEETGVVARLGRRLPTRTYPKNGRLKHVDYWAARAVASTAFTPNDEVDALVWLPVDEAERRLSYPLDAELLREFAAGPLQTRPLVILRHAAAGDKRSWSGPDELRPLDGPGRAQAVALADLLFAYGPGRLVSSATARCVETLLPYARRTGAQVVTEPAFTIGDTDARRACARLLDLAAAPAAEPLVVCTHGEIVSDLLTALCRELGAKEPDDPALDKGAFWALHVSEPDDDATPTLAALERHSV